MRCIPVLVLVLASCVPSAITSRASERLGATGKRLRLESHEEFAGGDVYTFCRVHRWSDAPDNYASCVMYVCEKNQPGARCAETPL